MSGSYECDATEVSLCANFTQLLELESDDYTSLDRWDASIRRRLALKGLEHYLDGQVQIPGECPSSIDKWLREVGQVNMVLLDSLCKLQRESNGSFSMPNVEFFCPENPQKTYEHVKDILQEYYFP